MRTNISLNLKTKINMKTVTIQADFITLNAFKAYEAECLQKMNFSRNPDEAQFWENQKLEIRKQSDTLRQELIKDEQIINF